MDLELNPRFCLVFGCSRTLTCSHRLRGLPPSSSGSLSLLHLRALAPQRHIVSSWQGTVEPQPPPHACSVVAWPVARQGFYGGQPTRYPGSRLSRGRSHSPHPIVASSYDEPPNLIISQSLNITVRGGRSYPPDQQPKSLQCLLSQVYARVGNRFYSALGVMSPHEASAPVCVRRESYAPSA